MLTKEEPTRLQHVVTTNESLIEVSPRVGAGEGIPLCKRARPQGTLPPQKRLICKEAVSIDAHLFYLPNAQTHLPPQAGATQERTL
jgi:hypothetical protein